MNSPGENRKTLLNDYMGLMSKINSDFWLKNK